MCYRIAIGFLYSNVHVHTQEQKDNITRLAELLMALPHDRFYAGSGLV